MWWLDGIMDSTDMSLAKLWEMVKDREAWRAIVHRVTKSQTWLSNWATKSHKIKQNILTICNCMGLYIHTVVRFSPSSTSWTFHLAKLKLCPHYTLNPHSPPQPPGPWLLSSTNVLSDSINLTILGISYKWNLCLNQWKSCFPKCLTGNTAPPNVS